MWKIKPCVCKNFSARALRESSSLFPQNAPCSPPSENCIGTVRSRKSLQEFNASGPSNSSASTLPHFFALSLSLGENPPLSLCSTVELEPGSPEEEFNSPTTACAISKSHDGDEEAHNSLTHSLRRRRHVWSVGPASSHSGSIERIVTGRCTGDDR